MFYYIIIWIWLHIQFWQRGLTLFFSYSSISCTRCFRTKPAFWICLSHQISYFAPQLYIIPRQHNIEIYFLRFLHITLLSIELNIYIIGFWRPNWRFRVKNSNNLIYNAWIFFLVFYIGYYRSILIDQFTHLNTDYSLSVIYLIKT